MSRIVLRRIFLAIAAMWAAACIWFFAFGHALEGLGSTHGGLTTDQATAVDAGQLGMAIMLPILTAALIWIVYLLIDGWLARKPASIVL